MAYEAYATTSDYEALGLDTFDGLEDALLVASHHIDTLTFNRIVAIGFDRLTEFQQDIIKEVVCRQALFEHENADEIESIITGYSINGVTIRYGDGAWNLLIQSGIAMSKSTYSFLEQTGLCYRGLVAPFYRR